MLALFLKTISTQLDFREHGASLCKTLLQREQLRLLDRGLTATKTKEHLISPCIRLLAEIVTFDGGAFASNIYSKRDTTLKRLDFFLNQRGIGDDDNEEDRRKPRLRRIAQRYVLANLKFQSVSARGDIIAQGRILRAFLFDIHRDASDMVSEILQTIEKYILNDINLSRNLKTRFLNQSNLAALALLYQSRNLTENGGEKKPVRQQAHGLLHTVCTQQEKGILVPQTGWYPVGTRPDTNIEIEGGDTIDLSMDSPFVFDNYKDKIPVKNGTLSAFIQSLRPDMDSLQAALLLDVFQAAPELVADYFSKKAKFNSEPKDSPAWLGQCAFLFSVIQLPVPPFAGWNNKFAMSPPPATIVIESILPRPLDRSMITRCLNLNHEIITLFALRVMTIASAKLEQVLAMFEDARYISNAWSQASSRLVGEFAERSPLIKDVILALRRASKDNHQIQSAAIELLATFFRSAPELALDEAFDVSILLVDVLARLENGQNQEVARPALLEQLNNLLIISQLSSHTKWWHKPGKSPSKILIHLLIVAAAAKLSPISCMIKVVAQAEEQSSTIAQISLLLETVLIDCGILEPCKDLFDALIASLRRSKRWVPEPDTFAFIDNCMSRIVRQPVHYQDVRSSIQGHQGDEHVVSLLVFCVAEQWPFIAQEENPKVWKNVGKWIARLTVALGQAGGGSLIIAQLQTNMLAATEGEARAILEKALKHQKDTPLSLTTAKYPDSTQIDLHVTTSDSAKKPHFVLEDLFGANPSSLESSDRLTIWDKAEIESVVKGGRVGRLLQCFTSPLEEVRRQAYATVGDLMKAVRVHRSFPMYLALC